jgi:colanic acid biosynthesis glycosyl transferase WcaI
MRVAVSRYTVTARSRDSGQRGRNAGSIVFAEQFYYPDGWGGAQIPRDITMHLAQLGWRVEVVCGSDQYVEAVADAAADPAQQGVIIRRVPKLLSGDIHRFKLARQLWYYCIAAPWLLTRGAAAYLTQTNPPLIVPLVALIACLRRVPFVIIAQDIYPEILFVHGMISPRRIMARALHAMFRWAYSRAMAVVSLGPTMTQRLVEKGVQRARITEISNWATGEEGIVRGPQNLLRTQWGLCGKFVIVYSGNLGVAHDVATPLRAVAKVLERVPDLVLIFIGKGSRLKEAQQLVEELGIAHAVQFRAFVPAELLPHSLGLADLALVTLRRGFEGLVVPSKLLGYLARGVPTLYVGPPSDVSSYLAASGGGVSFENDDVAALAITLGNLSQSPAELQGMGDNGRQYYLRMLTRSVGLRFYAQLVDRVVDPTG